MKASIIIPAYNAERTIAQTLEACLHQDFPPDEFEVIVVDDGSTDDTEEQVRRFPVRYIQQENAGRGAALNNGRTVATGDTLVFFDADCVPPRDWLHRLVEALQNGSRVGMVGTIYAPARGSSAVASAIDEEIRYRHFRSPDQTQHVGGFCQAISCKLFDEVGEFDVRFRRAQDNELSCRVAQRGYALRVLKDVAVVHDHPRTLRSWLKNQYYQAYWRVNSVRRHSKLLKGDGYVDHRDWLSLFLGMATIALLPFVWLAWVPWAIFGLVAVSALLQFPVAIFAVRDTGDWRQIVIVPMQVLRGLVWAVGGVAGLLSSVHYALLGDGRSELLEPDGRGMR